MREVEAMRLPKARWRTVTLGEIVERHVERCADPVKSGFAAFVGVDDLDSDALQLRRYGRIGVEALPPTFRFVFRAGMVLFPTRRPALRKCALAHLDGITGEKLLVLKSRDSAVLDSAFLPFLLSSEPVKQWAIKNAIGSVTPHFRWVDLAECKCALPSLEEQRSLSAVLQAVERARAAYKELANVFTRTSSAVLTACLAAHAPASKVHPVGDLLVDGPTNGISPREISEESSIRSVSIGAVAAGVFAPERFQSS